MNKQYLTRPTWLSPADFRSLIERIPQECCDCWTKEDLTVDHVVPRAAGGTDDLSNLCIRCRSHNSMKGTGPDRRYDRDLYFDSEIDLACLRTAQRIHAWGRMLELHDWFTRPWSQISRRLYTLAWTVGSGKTLAIPVLCFALNWIMRREMGRSCPRVRRVLVMCKERSIRDSTVKNLPDDLRVHGITAAVPRVKKLESTRDFDNEHAFESHDIYVGCIQLLWEGEGKSERLVDRAAAFLSFFDVIVFDEPHYAMRQVLRIVEIAQTSLCFGLTATPIDADGAALLPFVLFSIYGYDEAVQYDGSLKYVSTQPAELNDLVEEIPIQEADVAQGGTWRKIQDVADSKDYDENARPACTVVERVIGYIHECDLLQSTGLFGAKSAPHRLKEDRPELHYPVHAMIWTDTVEMGKTLVEHANTLMEQHRKEYPWQGGFRAEIVYAPSVSEDLARTGKPLDPTIHPWFYYQREHRLDQNAARILIVVGIGREGINNIYCGCMGVAAHGGSMIEVVQRWIGRQIRAVTATTADGEREVPPQRLDMIKIITHKAYDNMPIISKALAFVTDMPSYFANMVTMEELIDGSAPGAASPKIDEGLSLDARIDIIGSVGAAWAKGTQPDEERLVDFWGGDHESRRKKVRELIDIVRTDPGEAWNALHLCDQVTPRDAVMQEWPGTCPSDNDLCQFMERHNADLVGFISDIETNRPLLHRLYQRHVETFHVGDIPSSTNIDAIRKSIATHLIRRLTRYVEGAEEEWKRSVYSLVGSAVKQVIGTDKPVEKGGEYDCAQYHALLNRPIVQREIRGFVHATLIRQGWLPGFEYVFREVMAAPDFLGDMLHGEI